MTTPDISNLSKCIADSRRVCESTDAGPPEPQDYEELFDRFVEGGVVLPRVFRTHACVPFTKKLHKLGRAKFARLLKRDKKREHDAGQLMDIAQAILQNAEGYECAATDAYQEIVSDLYDGFLDEGMPVSRQVVAPLVKWGYPADGPYVWTARDNYSAWRVGIGIVNMPPALAHGGLLGWAILGHETTGHDILDANRDLMAELGRKVRHALRAEGFGTRLANYWRACLTEAASDVIGILNIGPAAGIGFIGHFRGWNKATGKEPILNSIGLAPRLDKHPAEILRGYLAAETVARLKFPGKREWATILLEETDKDARVIRVSNVSLTREQAHESAAVVAEVLVNGKMRHLRGRSLGAIQNWRKSDEDKAIALRRMIRAGKVPAQPDDGYYAAHALAAGIYESLSRGAKIRTTFKNTIRILQKMHASSRVWGRT